MLVRLFAALIGDAIFGSITSRHRRFQTEMLEYLDGRTFTRPAEAVSTRSR